MANEHDADHEWLRNNARVQRRLCRKTRPRSSSREHGRAVGHPNFGSKDQSLLIERNVDHAPGTVSVRYLQQARQQ